MVDEVSTYHQNTQLPPATQQLIVISEHMDILQPEDLANAMMTEPPYERLKDHTSINGYEHFGQQTTRNTNGMEPN